MVKVKESCLCISGRDNVSVTRRFRLADSAHEARADVERECLRCFNGIENRFEILSIEHVPDAETWPGYARFGGVMDIRKRPFTVWTEWTFGGIYPQALYF